MMNVLTVAAFVLALLYAGGVAVYVWRCRRRLGRWNMRLTLLFLAFYAAMESVGLIVFYRSSLLASGVITSLLQFIGGATLVLILVRTAKPLDPALLRYPYKPSREDKRLILLAMALPATALLAVFAVLIAHDLGALA